MDKTKVTTISPSERPAAYIICFGLYIYGILFSAALVLFGLRLDGYLSPKQMPSLAIMCLPAAVLLGAFISSNIINCRSMRRKRYLRTVLIFIIVSLITLPAVPFFILLGVKLEFDIPSMPYSSAFACALLFEIFFLSVTSFVGYKIGSHREASD